MTEFVVRFEFLFNGSTWYWEKKFYSKPEILDLRIANYLEQKTLPFELDTKIVKYRIK